MLTCVTISVSVCSISGPVLHENIAPLLSLLRESVQLNLAPPGHFLLLGSVFKHSELIPNIKNVLIIIYPMHHTFICN